MHPCTCTWMHTCTCTCMHTCTCTWAYLYKKYTYIYSLKCIYMMLSEMKERKTPEAMEK